MDIENQSVEPAAPETQGEEVPQQVEQESSAQATSEQTPEDKQADKSKDDQQTPKWAQKRIDELTRKRYQEQAQREAYQREAEQLRQQLAQLRGDQGDSGLTNTREQPRVDEAQIYAEAEKAAAFNLKCNHVYEQGSKESPEFGNQVRQLAYVAGDSWNEALPILVEADAPHKVIGYLAQNPDEAASLLSLSPVQMARAITKLEVKLATPAAPPVSKAPPPIKPVGSKAPSSPMPSDDDDVETWMRKERERMNKR